GDIAGLLAAVVLAAAVENSPFAAKAHNEAGDAGFLLAGDLVVSRVAEKKEMKRLAFARRHDRAIGCLQSCEHALGILVIDGHDDGGTACEGADVEIFRPDSSEEHTSELQSRDNI